ncbi:aminomethyltransferase [Vallitalea longa]|uniref:Aminomethyltransferase n=1 Tax=Vallitalea longa TaxID=2936439 RepID=A0A9W5YBX7_9FIRM|nr:glycine cleavage system aminomethyltransferase GcvT [Vallitalea longa]GKX29528.1 aminomethyltransferase [Vallitalea longa]
MEQIKRTALYDIHKKYNGNMVDFAGFELPLYYENILDEHKAVRTNAGMFDVSHMGEVAIKGEDAEKYIQNLVTNNIEVISEYGVMYTLMCYEDGGVVDDLLVYKYNSKDYLLVINASNIEQDFNWMIEQKGNYDVDINNISDNVAEVALQGPKAQMILQKLTETDLSNIKFFTFDDNVMVDNKKCLVSRTGYTGEDGFEIYTSLDNIADIWEVIMKTGKDEGLKPAGLGSRDTLRFEVALPLYGNEIDKDITPLEASLGYFVKLDTDFVGKEVLARQKEQGLSRKLIGIELIGKGIARHGYDILSNEGEKIGFITTGYQSPSVGKSVALGIVDIDYTKMGTEIKVQIRKKQVSAKVVSKKFYKKNYSK